MIRKKPCDGCRSKILDKDLVKIEKKIIRIGKIKNEVYEERCKVCNNLLYGYAKPVEAKL